VREHSELEVYECRILSGVDPEHRHPALAVLVKSEAESALVRTEGEEGKGGRYVVVEVDERIPDFWPARKWDRKERMMSAQQSKRVGEEIEKQRAAMVVKSSPGRATTPTYVRATVRAAVVLLHTEKFVTDGSDGETDWEES
jgi:hypothetical protein